MDADAQVFEYDTRPLLIRYGAVILLFGLGFWFFDFYVRGWLGGVPSLAVSLRHTFIIIICLVFAGGAFLKDNYRKLKINKDGLETFDIHGKPISLRWPEIVLVLVVDHGLHQKAFMLMGNPAFTPGIILLNILEQDRLVQELERLAGSEHALTVEARKMLRRQGANSNGATTKDSPI